MLVIELRFPYSSSTLALVVTGALVTGAGDDSRHSPTALLSSDVDFGENATGGGDQDIRTNTHALTQARAHTRTDTRARARGTYRQQQSLQTSDSTRSPNHTLTLNKHIH